MHNRFFDGGFNYLRIGFQEKNYYKELSVIGDANHIEAQYKKMVNHRIVMFVVVLRR